MTFAKKNNCLQRARVRLGIYRDSKNIPGYVIEAQAINESHDHLNSRGFSLTIYPYARKSMDGFANLKTANFLPYVMASRYARAHDCDDALVLNAANKIADASRANIFTIKGNDVFTPALHQGCVNGVMRRFVMEELPRHGFAVYQVEMEEADLLNAEEVFLTNSIYGARWVEQFKTRTYTSNQISSIYKKIFPGR